jgi:hypothetical protein
MITSALISQCRREFNDVPKLTRMARMGDGATNVFNTGRFPVVEGSTNVYKGTSAQTSGAHFTLDLDSGDLQFSAAPAVNIQAIAEFKYANWRDKNWMEAINDGIEALNARGFFKQSVRLGRTLSAGVRTFSGPSACIDVYELLTSPMSGIYTRPNVNWSYQQDANKIVLGGPPARATSAAISYLRRMQSPSATGMALDIKDDWIPLVKKFAGAKYLSFMATKIATQGNASIDEGHFSFTNARTQANNLREEFNLEASRAKPTRPAKDIQFGIEGGGIA